MKTSLACKHVRWSVGLAALVGLASLGGVAGCGAGQHPSSDQPGMKDAVLSLQQINCQSCGMRSSVMVEGVPGVAKAKFDRDTAELRVRYNPARTNPEALVKVVHDVGGFTAVVGAGQGSYTPNVEFPDDVDMKIISKGGTDVDIEQKRVPGKVTVFDFYAEWCGPCKDVDRDMIQVLRSRDDVALRKLEAADWESPVAKRYLTKVPALPYVIVYSKRGDRVAAISGLKLDELHEAIELAAQ